MMIETASKAPSKRLGWVSKLLLGAAALVLGTVVIAAFWINSIFSAHPKYNISIAHPALANEVTVQRDAYAIPHIQAQSEEDAFFALGYVHAQDRFWQMTLTKHFTQGRLTELFGDMVLDADISARTLNLQRKVDEAWPAKPMPLV